MRLIKNLFYTFIAVSLFSVSVYSQENDSGLTTPITDLSYNFSDCFSGNNLLLHLGSIGMTYALVESNADGWMLGQTSKMTNRFYSAIGTTGIITGYIAPIVLPAGLFLIGGKNSHLRNSSMAVLQSVAIAVGTNSVLKSITGRTPPNPDARDKNALSREFDFSFFGGDMHYGWPSGHLMTNMAMVSTLTSYYKDEIWLKLAGYSYIGALALSVLIDERGKAHWLSEIVTGSVMGYAIGSTVGNNMLRNNKYAPVNSSLIILPVFGNGFAGFSLRASIKS